MQSALCAFVAMACKPSSTESPAPDAARDGGGDLALEEQLMALGYLDHVQGDGGETRSGVVRLERARVSPGYTLTWLPRPCLAELIDIEGQVVRSWRMEDCKALNRADPVAGWRPADCGRLQGHPVLVAGGDALAA